MLYLQSLIIYVSLLVGMALTSQWAADTPKKWRVLVPVLLFSLIFGMRYGVGIDYYAYLDDFISPSRDLEEYYEPGFVFVTNFCHTMSLGSEGFFILLAFLQIFFLYLSFNKHKRVTIFLPAALILTGIAMTGYMNNIRQTIAFCIFTCSVQFIAEKKPFRYFLLVFLAFMFHKSALILIPIYFIWRLKNSYFNHVKFQIILAVTCFIAASIINLEESLGYFDTLIEFMGYSRYLESDRMFGDTSISIGYVLVFILYLIIIANSQKMKAFFADRTFNIMYDLFFIGILTEFLFRGSMMLNRLTYYFNGFKTILIAYILYFLFKNRKKSNLYYYTYITVWAILILFFVRLMVHSDENTVQFVFSFQEEWHALKRFQFNRFIL